MQRTEERAARAAVVVTGASTGIGRAIALELVRRGYRVFAGVRRDEDGQRLASDAADASRASAGGTDVPHAEGRAEPARGGEIVPLHLDVTVPEQVEAAVERVRADVGPTRLLGVVNNAGIVVAGPMEFLPLTDLRNQFEVNVLGQVRVAQAFLPMLRSSSGRLVFVGSVSGLVSSRLLGAYAASKFALEAVADAFRRELAPWGVRVSVVEPGRIKTPIWQKSVADGLGRMAQLPAQATAYYDTLMKELTEGAHQAATGGTPPEAVARAVHRALTSRRPRTRYFVGADAHIVNVMRRVVSDPLLDRIIAATGR